MFCQGLFTRNFLKFVETSPSVETPMYSYTYANDNMKSFMHLTLNIQLKMHKYKYNTN